MSPPRVSVRERTDLDQRTGSWGAGRLDEQKGIRTRSGLLLETMPPSAVQKATQKAKGFILFSKDTKRADVKSGGRVRGGA